MANLNINIEQGFIVHWCKEFLDHYGFDSEFPKTVSDIYTLKLAKMMADKGDLNPDKTVALFSNQIAVDELSNLVKVCNEAGAVLYKEAFGTVPIGSLEKTVDSKLDDGVFKQWLIEFENGNYESCSQLLSFKQ